MKILKVTQRIVSLFSFILCFTQQAKSTIYIYSAPTPSNDFQDLIYRNSPLERLSEMDESMQFGRSDFRPWSGSYWPTHKGMLARRYSDPSFPDSSEWSDNYNYVQWNTPELLLLEGRIDQLSPAEKYDLLLEDRGWALTRSMWQRGQDIASTHAGHVPTWWGICHGWSAANHMRTPEPERAIQVTSASGQFTVGLYPADIEALVAYLWAESSPSTLLIGSKCSGTSPEKNAYGRPLDSACLDNNPKSWHLSVVNRVGRDRDSLVMDASSGGEVWNYAIDTYYMRYFNPMTLKPSRSLDDSVVSREEYIADRFHDVRDPAAKYIVGVMMEVYMPAAIEPTRAVGKKEPLYSKKQFIYDLELDADFRVIGGEWHGSEHPDFLWTYAYDAKPKTRWDVALAAPWDLISPMSIDWTNAAREASIKGKVLAKLVYNLLERSMSPPQAPPPAPLPPPVVVPLWSQAE